VFVVCVFAAVCACSHRSILEAPDRLACGVKYPVDRLGSAVLLPVEHGGLV